MYLPCHLLFFWGTSTIYIYIYIFEIKFKIQNKSRLHQINHWLAHQALDLAIPSVVRQRAAQKQRTEANIHVGRHGASSSPRFLPSDRGRGQPLSEPQHPDRLPCAHAAKAELPFEHRVLAHSRGVRVLAHDEIGLEAPRPVSVALVPAAQLLGRCRWRGRDGGVYACAHTLKRTLRCQRQWRAGRWGAASRLAPRAVTFHAHALGQWSLSRREVRRASVMIFFNAPGCYTRGRSPSACLPAPTDALGPQTRDCLSWCAAAELVRAKHILILQLDIFSFYFCLHHCRSIMPACAYVLFLT